MASPILSIIYRLCDRCHVWLLSVSRWSQGGGKKGEGGVIGSTVGITFADQFTSQQFCRRRGFSRYLLTHLLTPGPPSKRRTILPRTQLSHSTNLTRKVRWRFHHACPTSSKIFRTTHHFLSGLDNHQRSAMGGDTLRNGQDKTVESSHFCRNHMLSDPR